MNAAILMLHLIPRIFLLWAMENRTNVFLKKKKRRKKKKKKKAKIKKAVCKPERLFHGSKLL